MYPVSKERRAQVYAEMWPSRPRWGLWAWWAQRFTGVWLVAYVLWHIVTISGSARDVQQFAVLMHLLTHPLVFGLLLLGLAYHTANGVRIVLFDLGLDAMRGRHAFWAFAAAAALVVLAGVLRGALRIP